METGPLSSGTRLSGWKEIAAHFGKTVRTVQRWERELDLPVRRLAVGRGESVYAFTADLDAWLEANQGASRYQDNGGAEPPGANRAGTTGGDGPPEEPRPEPLEPAAPEVATAADPRPLGKSLLVPGALTLALAILAGIVAIVVLFSRGGAGDPAPAPGGKPARRVPAAHQLDGNRLKVLDQDGRLLWEHAYQSALQGNVPEREFAGEPAWFYDLEGDGTVEVLFAARPSNPADHILHCFEEDGTERFAWRYHGQKRFEGGPDQREAARSAVRPYTYAAPWGINSLLVHRPEGGQPRILVVIHHWNFFPSALIELDASGNVTGEFWNDGHIEPVVPFRFQGREALLVGGCNNDFRSGFLAVLDADRVSGSSPPGRFPTYTCSDCPPGPPLRYLVFPETEVSRETKHVAKVDRLTVDAAGQVVVRVEHAGLRWRDDEEVSRAEAYYTLDGDLRPISAEAGQGYLNLHRRLEVEGYFSQPYGEEDRAALLPIWTWDGKRFSRLTAR